MGNSIIAIRSLRSSHEGLRVAAAVHVVEHRVERHLRTGHHVDKGGTNSCAASSAWSSLLRCLGAGER